MSAPIPEWRDGRPQADSINRFLKFLLVYSSSISVFPSDFTDRGRTSFQRHALHPTWPGRRDPSWQRCRRVQPCRGCNFRDRSRTWPQRGRFLAGVDLPASGCPREKSQKLDGGHDVALKTTNQKGYYHISLAPYYSIGYRRAGRRQSSLY